jgi:hypothetical protein
MIELQVSNTPGQSKNTEIAPNIKQWAKILMSIWIMGLSVFDHWFGEVGIRSIIINNGSIFILVLGLNRPTIGITPNHLKIFS